MVCFFNPGLDSPRVLSTHQSGVCKENTCTVSSSIYARSFININTFIPVKTAFSLGVALLFTEVLKQGYCLIGLILPGHREALMRVFQHCIAKGLQDQLQEEDLCKRHLYL